jgi:hypothetical protein
MILTFGGGERARWKIDGCEGANTDRGTIGLDTGATTYNFGLPTINVSPFAQLGSDKGDPRQRVDSNWYFIDNVSWKKGRHDIKLGYEFRRTSVSQIFNRTARGTLGFDTFSDFLAGIPDGGSQIFGNTDRNTFENSHALYYVLSCDFHRSEKFSRAGL